MFGKSLKVPSFMRYVHSPLVFAVITSLEVVQDAQSVADLPVCYCPCTDLSSSWLFRSSFLIDSIGHLVPGAYQFLEDCHMLCPFNLFSLVFPSYYFCNYKHRYLEKLFTHTHREGVIPFCSLKQGNLGKCI